MEFVEGRYLTVVFLFLRKGCQAILVVAPPPCVVTDEMHKGQCLDCYTERKIYRNQLLRDDSYDFKNQRESTDLDVDGNFFSLPSATFFYHA